MRGLRAPSSPRQGKPLSSSLPPLPSFSHSWPAGDLPVPLFFCFCLQVPCARCSGSAPKLETGLSLPKAQHTPTAAQT